MKQFYIGQNSYELDLRQQVIILTPKEGNCRSVVFIGTEQECKEEFERIFLDRG